MRTTFIEKLVSGADKKTYFLIGDLGYSVVEPFIKKHPDQFLNTGIAEQNMTGMAAGLAIEGYKVFTYSIGNFNTLRCLEQIRNDICYHNLDVNIVSVGGGLAYGSLGYSHHAVQDISILGSLPNMILLLPGDPLEVEFCMKYIFKNGGPKYLRMGKKGEKCFHNNVDKIQNINCFNSKIKSKIAIISVSTMLPINFEINEILKKAGVKSNIFSCTIIDTKFKNNILTKLKKFDYIFTIEEHINNFGFGSLVKNVFENENKKILSFGLKRDLCKLTGDQIYLCKCHGINPRRIAREIRKTINT